MLIHIIPFEYKEREREIRTICLELTNNIESTWKSGDSIELERSDQIKLIIAKICASYFDFLCKQSLCWNSSFFNWKLLPIYFPHSINPHIYHYYRILKGSIQIVYKSIQYSNEPTEKKEIGIDNHKQVFLLTFSTSRSIINNFEFGLTFKTILVTSKRCHSKIWKLNKNCRKKVRIMGIFPVIQRKREREEAREEGKKAKQ